MLRFTRWLTEKIIKDYDKIDDPKVRAKYGNLEGWVSIVINIILFVVKIFIGLSIHSVSLIADAVHTLADSATSIVIIIGFKMAEKPSDKEHPFGHGHMESIAGLIVSVLLFIAGVELLEGAIDSIIHPKGGEASITVIMIITATLIIKELLARFSFALGEIIDSKTLMADALHHRSDVFATGLVVVALICSRYGYFMVDGIMGIMVSLVIFYSAYTIAKESIDPLLGQPPSEEEIRKIEEIARSRKDVLGIHDIIFHRYGQVSIISLHVEVSDKENVSILHALSEDLEEEIAIKLGAKEVVVHIDPVNRDHPQYPIIEQFISDIVSKDQRLQSFHELRIIGTDTEKCNVLFDVVLEMEVDEKEKSEIVRNIKDKFSEKFPYIKLIIKIDPKFAFNF